MDQTLHIMKHALLLLSLLATQAHAQIIYTDVIPDITVSCISSTPCSASYDLDLNNDGTVDFTITAARYSAGGGCYTKEVYVSSQSGNGANSLALSANDTVDSDLAYSGSNVILRSVTSPPNLSWSSCITSSGSWSNGVDHYLGLQITNGTNTYYGWALLNLFFYNQGGTVGCRVKEYAYNSVPDEGILAGDMGSISTGITSTALRGMQVAPNPFTSMLNISLPTGTTGAVNYRVLSLIGQAVMTRTIAATSGPSAITLDLASLAPGTYLLEMQVDGERIVRKVEKL